MLFDTTFWNGLGWTAVTSIATSTVVAGLLQVRFKAHYDAVLARETAVLSASNQTALETHKALLSAENGVALERLRVDATLSTERFKKSYGLLADRQAVVIEEMYKHLSGLEMALRQCVAPMTFHDTPSEAVRLQATYDAHWFAQLYLREKRLFMPPRIATDISDILENTFETATTFQYSVRRENKLPEDWKQVRELWATVNGPMQRSLRELEAKLQDLLAGKPVSD